MRTVIETKGVQAVKKRRADGSIKIHYYHRASRTKISEPYGTVAFAAAVEAIDKAWREGIGAAKTAGTIAELIAAYKRSRSYTELAPRTRADYLKQIKAIEAHFGHWPIATFSDRRIRGDVIEWRDELARRSPKQADYALTVLVRILNVAYDQGRLAHNHIVGIGRTYAADRSERVWLPEHVDAFLADARPVLRQAMMLALHTGQRQGDLLSLTWAAYDGRRLALRQSKTGRRVEIPCTAALKQMLDGMKAKKTSAVILTNARGASWKGNAFRLAWGKAYDKAFPPPKDGEAPTGPDLTFHDLRGTAVTMLAEAGATIPEIAAITGHAMKSAEAILERYLARTRGLALAGIRKLERAPQAVRRTAGVQKL